MATTDRCGMTQCQAEKTGNVEQTNEWPKQEHKSDKEGEYNVNETIKHVAKQRAGHGGQHLADFATRPLAVFKVVRA